MSREIEVWGDWQGLGGPTLMGHLRASLARGKEIFSFSYGDEWLKGGAARQLDPELQLFAGPQYLNTESRPNFGLVLDSAPDRWGRLLMQRREAALARETGRAGRRLQETDYLLGVHDEQRSGGLRFKEPETGDGWLNNDASMQTPPWTSLRELEYASWKIQDDAAIDDLEELWRRIVFSIAVQNTDDHLRNHGFLLTESGWKLSPAYDLNPEPDGAGLSLNISETDNALSFDLALEVAPFFRLNEEGAAVILREVKEAVTDWEMHAEALGMARSEQDVMRNAFNL